MTEMSDPSSAQVSSLRGSTSLSLDKFRSQTDISAPYRPIRTDCVLAREGVEGTAGGQGEAAHAEALRLLRGPARTGLYTLANIVRLPLQDTG